MRNTVLIADEDVMFGRAISYILEQNGFRVLLAHHGREALKMARTEQPEFCLLSAGLAPISRFQLCVDLRRSDGGALTCPILVLGCQSGPGHEQDEESVELMLDCGADDYLPRPFGMKEFMARLYSLLRRARVPLEQKDSHLLQVGAYGLDPHECVATMVANGQQKLVSLSRRECALLHLLMTQPGLAVSRQSIAERVWGRPDVDERLNNSIDVHVRTLRHKLEPDPAAPRHILAVRGVGIRFCA